jgi:hypothetical protein
MRISITPIREEISRRLEESKNTDFSDIQGIRLIEKRNPLKDRIMGFDCADYFFDGKMPRWVPFKKLILGLPIEGYREVREPKEKDAVIYINGSNRFNFEFAHIGRVSTEGLILSKWTYGNVYLHPCELVPKWYGEVVRFFRKESS